MKWSDLFVIYFFFFGEAGFPGLFCHENERNIMNAMAAQLAVSPLEQQSYTANTFANFPAIPRNKKPFVLLVDNSRNNDFLSFICKTQLSSPQAIIIPIILDNFEGSKIPEQKNIIGIHFGYCRKKTGRPANTSPTSAVRRLIAFSLEITGYNRKDRQFQNYELMTMRAIANYMNQMSFNDEDNPRKNALPPYRRGFDDEPIIPSEFWH